MRSRQVGSPTPLGGHLASSPRLTSHEPTTSSSSSTYSPHQAYTATHTHNHKHHTKPHHSPLATSASLSSLWDDDQRERATKLSWQRRRTTLTARPASSTAATVVARHAGGAHRLAHTTGAHHSVADKRAAQRTLESELRAALARIRSLEQELNRARDERTIVEDEARGFKERMELAVVDFESLLSRAATEKTRVFQQLIAAKQQLQQAREQQRAYDALGAQSDTQARCDELGTALEHERGRTLELSARLQEAASRAEEARVESDRLAAELDEHQSDCDAALVAEKARGAEQLASVEETLRLAKEETGELHRSVSAARAASDAAVATEAMRSAERESALQKAVQRLEKERHELERRLGSAVAEGGALQVRSEARQKLARLTESEREGISDQPGGADKGLMARMLREQQDELRRGYLLSATCKLEATLDKRAFATLASAMSAWRELAGGCAQRKDVAEPSAVSGAMAREQQHELRDAYRRTVLCRLEAALGSGAVLSLARALSGWRRLVVADVEQQRSARKSAPSARESAVAPAQEAFMARMLREQQAELREAYRLSASCKLAIVLERRIAALLARAFCSWRVVPIEEETYGLHQKAAEAAMASAATITAAPATAAHTAAMATMLRAQQAELREGYLLSASCKLETYFTAQMLMLLARALAAWRGACSHSAPLHRDEAASNSELEALRARVRSLEQQSRGDAKENRALTLLINNLEAQLRADAVHSRAGPADVLPSPATPAAVRDSSRRITNEELSQAMSSAKRSSRLSDHLTTLSASKGGRSPNPVAAEAARCYFCGLDAGNNYVRCSSCYAVCYHVRCLSSRQARRFKGRRWLCDGCVD